VVKALFGLASIAALAITFTGSGWAQETSTRSIWNHNGSMMYLVVDGMKREFYYQTPRPGMLQAGAQQGSMLFSGESAGDVILVLHTFTILAAENFHIKSVDPSSIILSE
jgi:hypothetical protein